MADRVGQRLGNYTLTKLLGQGGFAEVYLGEHQYLKSQAAIKILQARLSSSDDMDSFLREAQTIGRLSHPNIVRVMDFGVTDEIPYLVMDYAPNGTLRQRHPRGTAVPLDIILPYVKQVADALQYAHDERLIHRDIKPENMLIGRRDEILLSDFGIALVAQSSQYQGTQDVIGTVAYMSPEQIQGKPRPASDQYSLAVVVYEWLTGDRPFHGSFTEMCTQHMFATPPPISEKLSMISPEVDLVVMKALDKDPKKRFESIQLFAHTLEEASQSTQLKNNTVNTSFSTVAMPTDLISSTGQPLIQNIATPGLTSNPHSTQQQNKTAATELQSQAKNTSKPGATAHSSETLVQTGLSPNQAPQTHAVPGSQPGNQFANQKLILPSTPNAAPIPPSAQNPTAQHPQTSYPPPPPPYRTNEGKQLYQQPNNMVDPYIARRNPGQGQYPNAQPAQPYTHNQQQPYAQPPRPQGEQPISPQQARRNSSPAHTADQGYSAQERGQTFRPSPTSHQGQDAPQRSEDDWGFLGSYKWHALATVVGIMLFCFFHGFHPAVMGWLLPAVLIIPIFFGASFGPIVGLLVGVLGGMFSNLIFQGADALHLPLFHSYRFVYSWWIPYLIYAVAGLAPGLAVVFRKKLYPSVGSTIRSCLLTIIGLGATIAFILYQSNGKFNEMRLYPYIGLSVLLTVGISFVILLVYSVAARLIDPA